MNSPVRPSLNFRISVFSIIPLVCLTVNIVLLVFAVLHRSFWDPVPSDAIIFDLDPLQPLAFLVAWSGLVGAIAVAILTKYKNLVAIYDEALRVQDETGTVLDDLGELLRESNEHEDETVESLPWIRRSIYFLWVKIDYLSVLAQRWYGWAYFFSMVPHSVLRLRWAISQLQLDLTNGGIETVPVPAGAAFAFLTSGSFLGVAIIERGVHIWRRELDAAERSLVRAKTMRNEVVALFQKHAQEGDE